uniref:Pepsin-I3 domain-containing protein n=1 Tax=Panagrellus redivivus TaxID=6233 RepID=A0A7E4W0L4_PANRE
MRTFTSICLVALVAFAAASPVKRQAGFGSALSTVGGNLGCVVTENKLYINGLYDKDLTTGEQEELADYEVRLKEFKKTIKSAVAERRNQLLAQQGFGGAVAASDNSSLPEPPKRPSFCSIKDTTQYIFDGCKVQNNRVYIGSTFARDLTATEQQELAVFDTKMTAYQKQVTASLQQQVKNIFGDQLASLFGGSSRHSGNRLATTTTASPADTTTSAATLEAPDAPNFCTIIY